MIAIEEVPSCRVEDYGVITGELITNSSDIYRVKNMFEKPKPRDLIEFEKKNNSKNLHL